MASLLHLVTTPEVYSTAMDPHHIPYTIWIYHPRLRMVSPLVYGIVVRSIADAVYLVV